MNRRVSILCLVLAAAAGMLFATCAPAAVVNVQVVDTGWWVCTELDMDPGPFPVAHCHAISAVLPNALGITRLVVYFHVDYATGAVWGREVFLTADGDALYNHFEGHEGPPFGYTQTFVGGTGRFAGATGTGTHWCHPAEPYLSPMHGAEHCTSDITLTLADEEPKMVPITTREGDLVSREEQADALYVGVLCHEDTYTGRITPVGLPGSPGGSYTNQKLTLQRLDTGDFHGFFTKTFPNGDTMNGYYEGTSSPLADPDARSVDMQLWIMGGTGRFENASGKQTGSGILWDDGRQDIMLHGSISSADD